MDEPQVTTPKSIDGHKLQREEFSAIVGAQGGVGRRDYHPPCMRRIETDHGSLEVPATCKPMEESGPSRTGERERSKNLGSNDEPSVGLCPDFQVHSVE